MLKKSTGEASDASIEKDKHKISQKEVTQGKDSTHNLTTHSEQHKRQHILEDENNNRVLPTNDQGDMLEGLDPIEKISQESDHTLVTDDNGIVDLKSNNDPDDRTKGVEDIEPGEVKSQTVSSNDKSRVDKSGRIVKGRGAMKFKNEGFTRNQPSKSSSYDHRNRWHDDKRQHGGSEQRITNHKKRYRLSNDDNTQKFSKAKRYETPNEEHISNRHVGRSVVKYSKEEVAHLSITAVVENPDLSEDSDDSC